MNQIFYWLQTLVLSPEHAAEFFGLLKEIENWIYLFVHLIWRFLSQHLWLKSKTINHRFWSHSNVILLETSIRSYQLQNIWYYFIYRWLLYSIIHPEYAADFISILNDIGLHQVDYDRNTINRLLDLVFTNDSANLEISQPAALIKIEDYHQPILITLKWHFSIDSTHDSLTNFTSSSFSNY